MFISNFRGYIDGADPSTIGPKNLTFPSRNVISYKGVVQTRPGITNDGTLPTTQNSPIIGEFRWPDAKSGEQSIRSFGQNIQIKSPNNTTKNVWFTIFSTLSATATAVRFATWTDSNGTIIKKRCFFVDGSANIYQWSGAVATIASITGANITISGNSNLNALGFDPGNTTAQTIIIVRFGTDGSVIGTETKTHADDCTDKILTLSSAPAIAPSAGDLVVAVPIIDTITAPGASVLTMLKDDIYTFPVTNKIAVTNLRSGDFWASSSVTRLDYTIPTAGSRTAASPFYLTLPGNIQAMISRGQGNSADYDVIWVSTQDSWFKIRPLAAADPVTGHWVSISSMTLPPRSGALPYMVSNFKDDLVFMSQEKRLHRIQTLEVLGKDDLTLLSDDVEGLLARVNMSGGRIYQDQRYIWICLPAEGIVLMVDMVGDPTNGIGHFWNPPQYVPVSMMSVFNGVRYGHSSARDETFTLFSGQNDLGVDITANISIETVASRSNVSYITHEKIGFAGRCNTSTSADITQNFEDDGAKTSDKLTFNGGTAKTYAITDDVNYGQVPWGTRALGDVTTSDVRRFFTIIGNQAISYFEHSISIDITGKSVDFRLTSIDVPEVKSLEGVGNDLYISR